MMNHHVSAGPGQPHHGPPSLHMQHQQSRRQQEYNVYHHPQSPSPLHPYPGYPHAHQYYAQAGPGSQYAQPRWQPNMYQPQQPFMMPPTPMHPPPHQQHPPSLPPSYHQPRSPMIVTSQPYAQNLNAPQRTSASMARALAQQQSLQASHSTSQPVAHIAPPSPAPTPTHEQERGQITPRQEATPPPLSPPRRQSMTVNPLTLPPEHNIPFRPQLPWYSMPDSEAAFLPRTTARRKKRQTFSEIAAVALPTRDEDCTARDEVRTYLADDAPSDTSTIAAPSELETPATSQAPSENDEAHASVMTTPTQSDIAHSKSKNMQRQQQQQQQQQQHARRDTRTAIAVPNIPEFFKAKAISPVADAALDLSAAQDDSSSVVREDQGSTDGSEQKETGQAYTPPPTSAHHSWADLVRRNAPPTSHIGAADGLAIDTPAAFSASASLADALKQYSVQTDHMVHFLEPRGLVNTGNMCYMNSILQVLVFCTPFYNFLDQVRQRTVHSIKSETPLVDAMIMFMREFRILASAESASALRKLLGQQKLEQYGDPVIPEYVYDAIRKLDRFNSMRHGHQQDAEEFLGFLLEGLHNECLRVMQGQTVDMRDEITNQPASDALNNGSAEGWLEVGPRQRASVTRTAGAADAPSPVTKIFGGHLRSELRVPGLKDSVTLEPYQPLQLDIGAQHVNNIVDALKGLTRTEALSGDFGGRSNSAKKQVFIDTLPPVLILHLKRFQYENNETGTQKIWKKVGYPLDLEIPKEVFTPSKRGRMAVKGGLPRYRLTSVVYHHGKSAAGGHYTVDVLREDGKEWVRMDDTVIRRIRPEDVAEGGAEEDPKLLVKALEQHKADQELQKQRNMYQGLDDAEKEPEEEKPWSEVNGHVPGHKKWASIANTNGTATPSSATGKRTPTARKENVRDNKVAYILFYEQIRA